ncbi:glycosyltransferase [Parvibaculum sedimenti]|uniref:Glycosyltransferase n=1 Tax=Parvibaculum sedimenti TaxID=2608632 RepID=A0A6N6VEV2_9HYPH|nr:glycosyltransferase family A protein [Parvibaculum sedimenti]KAB7739274.1 glycosyltransferase [Parvibaculum sedimenti]
MNDNQITYITTCKGRLHHLKQSLPVVASQPNLKVIVVDYDCPDRAGDWVTANFPSVEVVKVSNAPFFQLSHARNVGARAATTRWLAFFDADVVLGDGFFSRISRTLSPGAFFLARSEMPNLWGSVIVEREVFLKAGGYDEAITHWGGEDIALYSDLSFLGYALRTYDAPDMRAIEHGDDERVKFGSEKDLSRAKQLSHVYEVVRVDLTKFLGRLLNKQERNVLRARITQALNLLEKNKSASENVILELPSVTWKRPTLGSKTPIIQRAISYKIEIPR